MLFMARFEDSGSNAAVFMRRGEIGNTTINLASIGSQKPETTDSLVSVVLTSVVVTVML
jgi:hypothetical protein